MVRSKFLLKTFLPYPNDHGHSFQNSNVGAYLSRSNLGQTVVRLDPKKPLQKNKFIKGNHSKIKLIWGIEASKFEIVRSFISSS